MIKRIWKKILLNKKNEGTLEVSNIKKVLFMTMTYGLGDGIRNTGFVESLSEKYDLDFLGNTNQEIINRHNKKIKKIYVYKCKKNKKIIKSLLLNFKLISEIRKNKYDLIIDGHSSSKSFNLIFLRLLKTKNIIGMRSVNNKYKFKEENILLYDKLFDSYHEILSFLNVEKKVDIIRLPKGLETKYLDINPKIIFNTEGSTRKIEVVKLKETLNLLNKYKKEIWIICTLSRRDELEKLLSNEKFEYVKLLPNENFYGAIEFIRRCELLMSLDTSFIHVANLYNKKILGIYPKIEWLINEWGPKVKEYQIVLTENNNPKNVDDLGEINSKEIENAFKRLLKLEE